MQIPPNAIGQWRKKKEFEDCKRLHGSWVLKCLRSGAVDIDHLFSFIKTSHDCILSFVASTILFNPANLSSLVSPR
jgi:hypothetical protein